MEKNCLLELSLSLRKNVNYVNYQCEILRKDNPNESVNSFSFLKELEISNNSDNDYRDLTINFLCQPSTILSIKPIHLAYLPRNRKTVVTSFDIRLDIESLYKLTEKKIGSITTNVEDSSGEVLVSLNSSLSFLPIESSASSERIDEILASFITPNDPQVLEVISRAMEIKKKKYGSSSFEGYLLHDPNKVLEDMDVLYLALKELDIRYALAPASFESSFQRIRLPRNVLLDKMGNCLDFSILYASCLEAIGLRPLLIFFSNHALVGTWLEEESFVNTKEENSQTILNLASRGFNRISLLESTFLGEGNNSTFIDASEKAYEEIEKNKNFSFALDIYACRKEKILPVPTPRKDKDGVIHFDFPLDHKEETYKAANIDLTERRYLDPNYKGNKNRFDYWEDKLLDLNLRNRLISYKSGSSNLEALNYDSTDFLSFLETHNKLSLIPFSHDIIQDPKCDILFFPPSCILERVKNAFSHDSLLVDNRNDTAEEAIKNLSRKSNTTLEESGCNPLFLTIGLIRHFDNVKAALHGSGALYAPIFLLPIKLPRRKSSTYYSIEYSIDDLQLNRTAFEYFKENFSLDFSRLNPLPRKEDGSVDIRLIFNEIRQILSPMKNWALIENHCALSLFNFSHFVMWNDLKTHRQEMMNHPVIASFVYGEKKWNSSENLLSPEEMDAKLSPIDLAAPLPCDSSQIKAIVDAEKGESFILDGPPGTGKSQTIANMIVNFLYHNKKVLFVAEKEVALDVVKKRLDELKLGQYILELASLGTPKSEILANYASLLEFGPTIADSRFSGTSEEIMEKRKELNDLMNKLHNKGEYFLSPYEAIILYLENEKSYTTDKIPLSYLKDLNYRTFQETIEAIKEVARLGSLFSNYHSSPFLPFQNRDYSLSYREAIKEKLITFNRLINDLRLASYNAFLKTGIKSLSNTNISCYLAIIAKLQSGITLNSSLFEESLFLNKKETILKGAETYLEKEKLRIELLSTFTERTFLLDASALKKEANNAYNAGFFRKRRAISSFWKSLYPKNKKAPKKLEEVLPLLDALLAYKEKNDLLNSIDNYSQKVLKEYDFSNLESIKNSYSLLSGRLVILETFNKMNLTPEERTSFSSFLIEAGDGVIFTDRNEKLKVLYEEFLSQSKDLKENYEFDISLLGDDQAYFSYLHEKLNDALASIGRLSEWNNLLIAIDKASGLVPISIKDSFLEGRIKEENLVSSFLADVSFNLLTLLLSERGISTLSYEKTISLIEEYRKDILRFQSLSIEETASRISSSFPQGAANFAHSTKAYQLSKLAKNGGRGATLRSIFHEYKDLISLLTPCFMTSPATLAQYLDPSDYHFDVVIFDEASQIPTSEAIGALFRADSFVIAGDKEQMPPSNYFVTTLGGNDEGSSLRSLDEDLESLLDDALVLHLPRKRLSWHYRSNHESLIAFSNNRFYDNTLLTFPSPKEEKASLSFHLIKGAYEKGRGINRPEAKAIVSEIIRRLKNPSLRKYSIGVVTFNEAQQNLVEDLLEKELALNPRLSSLPGGEKIFVKNLENVQGDERDVILFGITYGPDRNGNLSLNFGPLSLKKGERRLNVAVSRAREAMVVFSSFEPEMIRAERAKNEGASYLKNFLKYVKYGERALPLRAENIVDVPSISVATFLANDLRKLGYVVKENLGSSSFKIDLAIAKKENPDDYILGIMFDTPKFASLSCRDRHINEPNVLSKLTWKLLYLYSLEYLDHKEEVLKKVVNSLNEPTLDEDNKNNFKMLSPNLTRRPSLPPMHLRPYLKSDTEPKGCFNHENLIYFLEKIIEDEFPISDSLLDSRIRKAFSLGRISYITRNIIDSALRVINPKKEECGGHTFYYPNYFEPFLHRFWRKTDQNISERRLVDISFIEIGNAAADIISEQGKMSINDLAKTIMLAFGYESLYKGASDYLKAAIRWNASKRNGLYLEDEDTVAIR